MSKAEFHQRRYGPVSLPTNGDEAVVIGLAVSDGIGDVASGNVFSGVHIEIDGYFFKALSGSNVLLARTKTYFGIGNNGGTTEFSTPTTTIVYNTLGFAVSVGVYRPFSSIEVRANHDDEFSQTVSCMMLMKAIRAYP